MRLDPTVMVLLVILIGVAAGLIFDRVAGPGWFSRQFAGTRGMVTSALVGIAGSFIGYHIALLLALRGVTALIGAVLGAAVVLWAWRMAR
jgi:uncharacterized membrane protein YeaQ/YmgE (transglycosylase-associated protein family)